MKFYEYFQMAIVGILLADYIKTKYDNLRLISVNTKLGEGVADLGRINEEYFAKYLKEYQLSTHLMQKAKNEKQYGEINQGTASGGDGTQH